MTVMVDNKNRRSKTARQSRQISGVYADANEAIKGRYALNRAADMVNWITCKDNGTGLNGGRGLSLRWLEKHTSRGFGFWQHIAKRHRCVVLRRGDYDMLTRTYKILLEHQDADGELLDLLMACQRSAADMMRDHNNLIDFVRRRLGAAQ